ncbi:STAS domain-containing protein [Dactylosporangium sp. CA-092794]|uniref:STAS domain-containing protein n=1 Tax=Dactylosporangium sp. CA-092794 TaxID=3239929 RepID=UPI003D91DCA1
MIVHRPEGGGVRLALAGELDIATVPLPERHVGRALTRRPGHLLLDLAGVRFCDSTGVAALIDAHTAAAARHVALRVVNANDITRRVMQIMGTLDALT